jgi:hypothetical protein
MAANTTHPDHRPNGRAQWWRAPALWLGLLVAVGLVFRLRQFLFDRSFWHDETLLATTFVGRSLSELLSVPLANNQAAPAGYLLLVKLVTDALGMHEWTLRLVSLLSGVGVLLLAVPIARRLFPSGAARATFVALVSASPALVYYSSEFKQYQGDVLGTLVMLWLTLRFSPEHHRRDAIALAAAGALSVWLSHPAPFVLAGSGLALWLDMARQQQRSAQRSVSAAVLLWLVSFAIHYLVFLRHLPHNDYLNRFWSLSFAPAPPLTWADLLWYREAALGLVYLGTRQMGTAFSEVLPGWFSAQNGAVLLLTLAGSAALGRQSPRTAVMGALSLLAVLGASALHQYPFRTRLILFLVPFVFIALAALVERLHRLPRRLGSVWLAAALALAVVWTPSQLSLQVLRQPNNYQDIRGALQHIARHLQPGDHAMIGSWTYPAYSFYAPRTGLADLPLFVYQPTANEVHNIRATVRRICSDPTSGRTWVLATHQIVANNRHFLAALNNQSPPLFTLPLEGGALFLHDFRPTAYCQRYRSSPGANSR